MGGWGGWEDGRMKRRGRENELSTFNFQHLGNSQSNENGDCNWKAAYARYATFGSVGFGA